MATVPEATTSRPSLIFLISMVGMVATASSLAQFAQRLSECRIIHHLRHSRRGYKAAVAVGVITIIAFGGVYIFVGSYIVQNVFGNAHVWRLTQIVTIAYGALVVAPGWAAPRSWRPTRTRSTPRRRPCQPVQHPALAAPYPAGVTRFLCCARSRSAPGAPVVNVLT